MVLIRPSGAVSRMSFCVASAVSMVIALRAFAMKCWLMMFSVEVTGRMPAMDEDYG